MSHILSLNTNLELKKGVYHALATEQAFDAAFIQEIIMVFSAIYDKSSDSIEIENTSHKSTYINIYKPSLFAQFALNGNEKVLEISHDFGNITRYFAEKTYSVTSVKPDNFCAALANAKRCADLENTQSIAADIHTLLLPEKEYDLIVVSDVEAYASDAVSLSSLMKKLHLALSERGRIFFTKPNPQAMSHWFDAHTRSIPYHSLYQSSDSLCMTLGDWHLMLEETGLYCDDQYMLLPNAHRPRSLLSKEYVEKNPAAINHFYGVGMVENVALNEYLFLSNQERRQALYTFANAHFFLLSKQEAKKTPSQSYDFIHYSNFARKREWRTVTYKNSGENAVNKVKLFADAVAKEGLLEQNLAVQDFIAKKSLVSFWLHSTLLDPSGTQLDYHIQTYYRWLSSVAQSELGWQLYDLLPFNILCEDGSDVSYRVIDAEWKTKEKLNPGFVLFRALFWFALSNKSVLQHYANQRELYTIKDFIEYCFNMLGLESEAVKQWLNLEIEYQQCIERYFDTHSLPAIMNQSVKLFEENSECIPFAQIFFYQEGHDIEAKNSFIQNLEVSNDYQSIHFSFPLITQGMDSIRIDPIDCVGIIHIKEMTLYDKQGVAIWNVNQHDINQNGPNNRNVEYINNGIESFFIAQNEDPYFLFPLIGESIICTAHSAKIEMCFNSSVNWLQFKSVVDDFSVKQQDYEQKIAHQIVKEEALLNDLKYKSAYLEQTLEQTSEREKHLQGVINQQIQMMMRTPTARLKSLIERVTGKTLMEKPDQNKSEEQEVEEEVLQCDVVGQDNEDYACWLEQHSLSMFDRDRIEREIQTFDWCPVFSIVVPVYNIDEKYLLAAVESVRMQLYPHWELCLVDDASPAEHIRPLLQKLAQLDTRIKIQLNETNQGIGGASNDGLKMATGDYIALLDHDDEISIDALYENAKAINRDPEVGFLYSDEDKLTMEGRRVDPFFKPDYSPDLLDSTNYICHFSVIKRSIISQIGGFRLGFDGSQDHDLIIRAVDAAEKIIHIPKVLYHWRKVPGSTADVYDSKSYAWEAGRKAVESRLLQSSAEGSVVLGPLKGSYQVKRNIVGKPLVSIVIPFKDKPELLEQCLNSILQKSTYSQYEIIGISNQSEQDDTHALMQQYQEQHENIHFFEYNQPFNFSQLCNYGVQQAQGEYIILLNNDIEIASDDWIERLLEHAQRKEIGAVGGKLFYPDGRIQHAGIVAGMHGAAGHSHLFFSPDDIGYYGYLSLTRNVSAVTGAMFMVSKEKYAQVGGLDETHLAVAYNDVDFCLKLLQNGYYNLFTPFCQAVHHESASRGYEDNEQKKCRFTKEREYFLAKWADFLQNGDPYFNPNFDLRCHRHSLKLD